VSGQRDRGAVVIITGPPGAGKTTVAAALAAGSAQRAVHLHSDDFYDCIRSGYVAPYLAAAHEQNRVVTGVLAGAAFGYAAGGYLVMLDGIIGPWFLDPFRARRDAPLHYVVLRPELPETLRRAQGRAGRDLRESGPIRSLHQQFSQLGDLEPHALDTTALTAGQTVSQVRAALAAGRLRLLPGPGPALAPPGPAPAFS
jgi:chloramphenicol 3-O-phosphotransferase